MKSKRYPYRITTPLPMIWDGGTLTPIRTDKVNIPNMTTAPERMSGVKNKKPIWNDPDLKANLSAGDLATGVAGMLSNGVTDYFQTGNLGNAISSIVDTGIKSIPVAGQIVAAADMVADPIASAFGNAASSDPYNQTAKRFINPLNSLESGISNLVNGNSSEGWIDLASVVLPGLGGVMDANKAKEKARLEDLQRFKAMQASVKSTDIKEGRGGKYWDQNQLMQAEMGGPLRFMEPTDPKLPAGRIHPFYYQGSSERASSIGGEQGEPAYLIPTFKYGQNLNDPREEFEKTGEHLGGPFKTWQEADKWEQEVRHPYVEKNQTLPSPLKRWGDMEQGGPIFDQNSTPKSSMVTVYNEGGQHSENPNGGIPVDSQGNRTVASNARPVATTEEGEISYFSKRNGSAYVFSNKLFAE